MGFFKATAKLVQCTIKPGHVGELPLTSSESQARIGRKAICFYKEKKY